MIRSSSGKKPGKAGQETWTSKQPVKWRASSCSARQTPVWKKVNGEKRGRRKNGWISRKGVARGEGIKPERHGRREAWAKMRSRKTTRASPFLLSRPPFPPTTPGRTRSETYTRKRSRKKRRKMKKLAGNLFSLNRAVLRVNFSSLRLSGE